LDFTDLKIDFTDVLLYPLSLRAKRGNLVAMHGRSAKFAIASSFLLAMTKGDNLALAGVITIGVRKIIPEGF
jgi:hypothetical protein